MINVIVSSILHFKQLLQSVSIGSILGLDALSSVTLWDITLCLFILSFLLFIFSGLSDDDDE